MKCSLLSSLISKFILCFRFFLIFRKKSERAVAGAGIIRASTEVSCRIVSTIPVCKNRSSRLRSRVKTGSGDLAGKATGFH